ncbi:MAG: 4Fe-4S dicluster domain-containing protein [Thiohalomonadaceae bacterium]
MTDSKDKQDKVAAKPVLPVVNKRKQQQRRQFLRSLMLAAGVVGISTMGYIPVARSWHPRLRPPGALDEAEFLASCIKCGQCVQVCPVEAIKLADIMDGFGVGVPYVGARDQACDFSCDGLQCILACPTGALSHDLNYPHEIRMGFARLDRPDLCLAMHGAGFKGQIRGADFTGLFRYSEIDRWKPQRVHEQQFDLEICDLCITHCPIEIRIAQCEAGEPPSGDVNQCPPKHAIELRAEEDRGDGVMRMRPVVLDGCVGCGACEMVCPTEQSAIVVDIESTVQRA